MRRSQVVGACLLVFAPMISLAPLCGCGDGQPASGTMASPVDKDVAAQQNKAMQDFVTANKKQLAKAASKR